MESVRVIRNAHHVLGLSTGADLNEIKRRASHLLNLARIEETEQYETDLPGATGLRTEQNIRKALEKLTTVKSRLIESFFWFETPTIQDHKSLKELALGNLETALQYWKSLSSRSPNWVAKKNEALAYFISSYQTGDVTLFEKSLLLWREIGTSDQFWIFYQEHYKITDDLGTDFSSFVELRTKLFEYLSWLALDLYRKNNSPLIVKTFFDQTEIVGLGIEDHILNPVIIKIKNELDSLDKHLKDSIRLRTAKVALENSLNDLSEFGVNNYSPIKALRESCAVKFRALSIEIHNETNDINLAKELLNAGASLSNSESYLLQVERDKAQLKKNDEDQEALKREISYEVDLGLIFKDKFKISPDGVSWKDRHYPLSKISRVRWGGISKSVNGIPTGTTYIIAFGDEISESVIGNANKEAYQLIIQKLWRAVGVRLMTSILQSLREGNKIRFGDALIDDKGVELTKHHFFSSERSYRSWGEVQIYSAEGSFFIKAKDDKKCFASMSYIETQNTHIIEACISAAFKTWKGRLSGLLD